ncbi:MAG: type II toxin-antitoxin system HicB family antitoxin [Spirochaetota bacterium]
MRVETEREDDGLWIAEIPEIPGAMVHGADRAKAKQAVESLASRILADRLELDEDVPGPGAVFAVMA